MNLFTIQPKLTRDDIDRLLPCISNSRIPLQTWLATNPSLEDLKRAVMIEVKRAKLQQQPLASLGRGVLSALLRRIGQLELSEIDKRIRAEVGGDK